MSDLDKMKFGECVSADIDWKCSINEKVRQLVGLTVCRTVLFVVGESFTKFIDGKMAFNARGGS